MAQVQRRFQVIDGGAVNEHACPIRFTDRAVTVFDDITMDDTTHDRMVEISARAYHDPPNAVLAYLSNYQGTDALRLYMDILLHLTRLHGWVISWRDPTEDSETLVWLIKPGEKVPILEQLGQLWRVIHDVSGFSFHSLRLLWDVLALEASHNRAIKLIKQRTGSTDHVYALSFAAKNGGHGGLNRILRPVLDWCQTHQLPVYLEAADECNVRRYWRFDFQKCWNIGLWANWIARKLGRPEPLVYPAMIWWPERS